MWSQDCVLYVRFRSVLYWTLENEQPFLFRCRRLCELWTKSKTQTSTWKILSGKERIFPPYQRTFLMKNHQEVPVLKCVLIAGFSLDALIAGWISVEVVSSACVNINLKMIYETSLKYFCRVTKTWFLSNQH